MADIFVSYAHEDQERVRPIVAWLERQNWSVFWDRRIPTGQTWRSHIGKGLSTAGCVLVTWSRHSVDSRWVVEEAEEALGRGVLVPVLLDAVQPPIGFRGLQAADLSDWQEGNRQSQQLLDDIRAILGSEPLPRRPAEAPAAAQKRLRIGTALLMSAAVVIGVSLVLAWNQGWLGGARVPQPRPPAENPAPGASGSVQAVAIDYFRGDWENTDPATRGLTRVTITVADGNVTLHAWGKCHPSDCDWGQTRAEAYAEGVSSNLRSKVRALGATFKSSFKETTFLITPLGDNQLRLATTSRFTDNSGRNNYSSNDVFRRAK